VLRVLLTAVSFVIMFFPDAESGSKAIFTISELNLLGLTVPAGVVPVSAAALVVAVLLYGTARYQRIAEPPAAVAADDRVTQGDAAELIAEAKRDLG
jgi:hypothetical protein